MVMGINLILVIVTSLLCHHNGVDCAVAKAKRDAASVTATIASKIKDLPAQLFVGDKAFTQKVDKANKLTTYMLKGDQTNEVIYERSEIDKDKDVVVLMPEEDKIPFKKMKRVYIVLKKIDEATYVGAVAFIRDAGAADKDPVDIDGKNRVIEWGVFDEHFIFGRNPVPLLTATCSTSMIVNCVFNASTLAPIDKYVKSPHFKPKVSPKPVKEEVEAIPLTTGDGSDSEDDYELYRDLETTQMEGRGFGDVLGAVVSGGLIPGVLSGATALICGGLAIIGLCGHGRGQTDLTIINESGVPLDQNMIAELAQGQGKRRRKRETASVASDFPGWKTQFITPTNGGTIKIDEDNVFHGFGNCPYIKPSEDLLTTNPVLFYRQILRTDCINAVGIIIGGMLADGLITAKDKVIEANLSSPAFQASSKTGIGELILAGAAIEISAFSKVYQKHIRKSAPTILAPGRKRKISKSMAFFGDFFLTYMTLVREKARNHMVSLLRTLFLNGKGVFNKLSQDAQNLERCADCVEDKEVNFNDRIYSKSLTLFLKRGIGTGDQTKNVYMAFVEFYKANMDKFEKFVNIYS